MAEGDALGIGRFGSLGLAFMAAVVSAAISWGVQLDRSDQASDQIVSLSNRITTLALQIHPRSAWQSLSHWCESAVPTW